jgi:phage portal protein BeeE
MGLWQRIFGGAQPRERRSSGSGYTAEIMAARESYISGRRGLGELTATVQACVSLWEAAFAIASVTGTDLLDRRTMALLARSVALRGEALFLVRDEGLVPAADWDLSTRHGRPRAYRVSVSEAGGGRSETALAAEVLHLRIGSDPVAPWIGTAPLRRAALTAGLLHELETAVAEVYAMAPIGSQVVPMPENPEVDNETLGRDFRGRRGRVLLRESVQVTAAGGPAPAADWRPASLTPDLRNSMAAETLEAARGSIALAFGVLPGLLSPATTGPMVRECQRHLATWALQPIAELLAEEASQKLGSTVAIDVLTPLQAFDAGGSARAAAGIVQALVQAKEGGLTPAEVQAAFGAVDWSEVKG